MLTNLSTHWTALWVVGVLIAGAACSGQQVQRSLLVSPDEAMVWPAESAPVVLDVRSEEDYLAGHLPGAIRVDVATWKKETATDEQLLDAAFWESKLGAMGIDGQHPIVVYGKPITEAARVWWLLKLVGCRDVRLLDGGYEAYVQRGGQTSTDAVSPQPAVFKADFQRERIVTADELHAVGVVYGQCQIIDNRSEEEFSGRDERGPRSGHIPGAQHSDWRDYLAEDGTFLPVAELQQMLADEGIDLDVPLVTHCHSGGRSSVGAFVLELVTGRPARNYYRSWTDWSAREDLPIDR